MTWQNLTSLKKKLKTNDLIPRDKLISRLGADLKLTKASLNLFFKSKLSVSESEVLDSVNNILYAKTKSEIYGKQTSKEK